MDLITLAEKGWLPDRLIRVGIRRLLRDRIARSRRENHDLDAFVRELRASPLAVNTADANRQHYEAPSEFFRHVLGPRLKYSCCHYDGPESELAEAEDSMLRLTCHRAGIEDGQSVLELGCGWGSLSLWMAQQYPNSQITAVSNSRRQRRFILDRASELGVQNLQVETADMVDYRPDGVFDRIVSVEMFEHMRNYQMLFSRVAEWLAPEGKVFVHVFCHADEPYLFETDGANDWMARHFFTGGVMPSENLFSRFKDDLLIADQWRVNGIHYGRTCEDWLRNLDERRGEVLCVFRGDLSAREARIAVQRWRIFFMACAELFKFDQGNRWFVSHYLFEPVQTSRHAPLHEGAPSDCGVS